MRYRAASGTRDHLSSTSSSLPTWNVRLSAGRSGIGDSGNRMRGETAPVRADAITLSRPSRTTVFRPVETVAFPR